MALLTALLLGTAVPPAAASCQSFMCQQLHRLRDRQEEAERLEIVRAGSAALSEGRGPAAAEAQALAEAALELLDLLTDAVWREREIRRYGILRTWSWPPPVDLPAQVEVKRSLAYEVLGRLAGSAPRAACFQAGRLPDPADRLARLRSDLAAAPTASAADAPSARSILATCLARELLRQGRSEEGEALLRAQLRESWEPQALDLLVQRLRERPAERRALLEEVAELHPDVVAARLRLLVDHLREPRDDGAEVAAGRLVQDLLARPLTLSENLEVCLLLERTNPDLCRECWRSLWDRPFPDAEAELVESARSWALDGLVRSSWQAGDPGAAASWAAEPSLGPRIVAWEWLLEASAGTMCDRFVAAFDAGELGALDTEARWQAWKVARALATCGREERRRAWTEATGIDPLEPEPEPERVADPLRALRGSLPSHPPEAWPAQRWLDAMVAKMLASEEPGSGPLVAGSPLPGTRGWPDESADPLPMRLYEARLHGELARRAEVAGEAAPRRHQDQVLASLDAAVAARPDDLDLVVLQGAAALRFDRPERVRAAAERLTARHATPRHLAEADYLLGRLARREGRWEEASDRLARYFLERVRFVGPAPPGPAIAEWERPFFLHLVEAGHHDRLAAYLEAREAALVDHRTHQPPPPEWDRPPEGYVPPTPFTTPDSALLSLDCVSPRRPAPASDRTLRGEKAPPSAPARPALPLTTPRPGRPCTPAELPDPEPLFPDDELLSLGWSLRGVH